MWSKFAGKHLKQTQQDSQRKFCLLCKYCVNGQYESLTWDLELKALNISKNTKQVKVMVVSRGVITLSLNCQQKKMKGLQHALNLPHLNEFITIIQVLLASKWKQKQLVCPKLI